MTKLALAAIVAAMVSTATLTVGTDPASAWGRSYCCERGWAPAPRVRPYRPYRLYRGPARYYRNPCGYGDCACIRGYAIATGAEVWWDRYQACTGQ
jgi:hypothetical protein